MAIGPAKAGIGFLGGISRSKELLSVEKLSRESTRNEHEPEKLRHWRSAEEGKHSP
jgi:hypothetical protein